MKTLQKNNQVYTGSIYFSQYDATNTFLAPGTFASPHAVTSIGEIEFEYDNNGNLISDGTWEHSWDYKDRLISSVLAPEEAQEVIYEYDEAKQRITKNNVTDEEITLYVDKYFDREGATEKVYIYAGNTKIASIETEDQEETLVFHHEDHLTGGNVDTDNEGEVVQLLDYFPYGDSRIDESAEDYHNDYQFTGKERDEETGLSYYEARYYNSGIARFIARDPWEGDIKDPQSLNKYSYVQNNPLKYVDPSGEETQYFIRLRNGIDTGHAMVNINGNAFGFTLRDKGDYVSGPGRIVKQSIDSQLEYYSGTANGKGNPYSTYTSYELDISQEQENSLLETLNNAWKEQNVSPYNIFTYNCVDFAREYINENTGFNIDDTWTPDQLSKSLYDKFQKGEGIKDFSIGFEQNGKMIKSSYDSEDTYSDMVRETNDKAEKQENGNKNRKKNKSKSNTSK